MLVYAWGLYAHRKRYNFIADSTCPQCGFKIENEVHYLLNCPRYAIQRAVLVGSITDKIENSPNLNIFIPPRNKLETDNLVNLLLRGSSELSEEININISKAVQVYVMSTRRFL